MNLEDQLRVLIDSSPPHIQRHFACDCAERALKAAKVKDERSWLAVEVSRRYAEGKATDEELDAARSAAGYAAWSAARYTASSAAWSAAGDAAAWSAWSARSAAWAAARSAAESAAWAAAAREEERKWQIAHLKSLIATHNATRSSLLHILQQRAEALRPTFTQYARTLEERVFE